MMRFLFILFLVIQSYTASASVQICPRMPTAAAVANQWINSISAAGAVTQTQPGFSNLSGSLACSQHPALTGDVTTSAGNCSTTLATVNSNTGTFGNATTIPVITVNGKGLITAVTTASATASVGGQGSVWTATFTTAASSSTSTIYAFELCGGGGGGGGSNGGQAGGAGGGSGGWAKGTFTGIAANTTVTITTGSGGSAGTTSGTTGGTGGSSSIAATGITTITTTGGSGGTGNTGSVGVSGGSGGSFTSGTASLSLSGSTGRPSWVYTGGGTVRGGDGASSPYGSGGIGGAANVSGPGTGAQSYCAGGGGGIGATAAGGAGGAGVVFVTQLTP